jgi:hypothetical protein
MNPRQLNQPPEDLRASLNRRAGEQALYGRGLFLELRAAVVESGEGFQSFGAVRLKLNESL